MTTFGNTTYLVGSTLALEEATVRPVQAEPDEEYAVSQGGPAAILPFDFDRMLGAQCRKQPASVLREVSRIPAIQSSLYALKSMVLSANFEFTPSVAGDEVPEAKLKEAAKAVEECELAARQCDTDLKMWAWEMMNALGERNKLAEIILRDAPGGKAYTLGTLKVLPEWCYRYRVDDAMNVTAIDVWSKVRDDYKWLSVAPSKFTWLSYEPEDNDPRGNSILDAVMDAVNRLCQLWPEAFQYWKEFGSPRTVVIVGGTGQVQIKDANGNPTSKTISRETDAARKVSMTRAGATVGLPEGSDAKILESVRDGQSLDRAIQILEEQCVKAILITPQATVEARHASRADSDTKKSVLATFAGILQEWVCHATRKPFFELLKANHDEAYAREFCPYLSLGRVDPETMVKILTAIGLAYQSGALTEGQMPYLDELAGIPRRRAGDERIGPQKDAAKAQATPTPTDDEQATRNTAPAVGGAA